MKDELIMQRDWEKLLSPIAPETVKELKKLEADGFVICAVRAGTKLELSAGSSSSSIAWYKATWWVVAGKPRERQVGVRSWQAGTAGGRFIQTEVTLAAGDAVAVEIWDGTGMELRIKRKVYVAVPST